MAPFWDQRNLAIFLGVVPLCTLVLRARLRAGKAYGGQDLESGS